MFFVVMMFKFVATEVVADAFEFVFEMKMEECLMWFEVSVMSG